MFEFAVDAFFLQYFLQFSEIFVNSISPFTRDFGPSYEHPVYQSVPPSRFNLHLITGCFFCPLNILKVIIPHKNKMFICLKLT